MKKDCTYILKSEKDGKFYVGQTGNLVERVRTHNRGSVNSTKNRRPVKLVYFETFDSRIQAVKREAYIKSLKNTSWFLESAANMAPSSNG
mgnify:CR=1 FL=1